MVMTVLWFYGHVSFVTCGLRLELAADGIEIKIGIGNTISIKIGIWYRILECRNAREFAEMELAGQTCMKMFSPNLVCLCSRIPYLKK